ncbi:hypothetical protein HDR66_01570, partial [bacterium]|nr:hypothetical protein [bacterium]
MLHHVYAMKSWKKLLVLMGTLLVIGAIIFGAVRIISGNSNTAKFRMTINTPTPAEFTDDITTTLAPNNIPEVNNNREIDGPGELIVSFEQTAGQYVPPIKIDITDADIERYAQITPAIPGRWRRYGPNTLAFMPGHNWPANTKFNVRINPAIINDDARISNRNASFTTAPIVATVDSFNTYLAGNHTVTAVAVISFNYPIDIKNFRDHVTLRVDGDKTGFDVRFDKFHRTALIQSEPIKIITDARDVRLKINRISAASATATTQKITATTNAPAADNVFKISSVTTTVADDAAGVPQQLLLIDTTAPVADNIEWNRYVKLYLLPAHRDASASDDDAPHKWADDEITPDVIRAATQLKTKPIKFESPMGVYQYAISYDVNDGADRFIYAEIKKGIPGGYGFTLKNPVRRVLSVPYPEKSVKIAGSGALLAMGGDRKLGLVARGGAAAAYINLAKVKSSEINHLISQTYNVFS